MEKLTGLFGIANEDVPFDENLNGDFDEFNDFENDLDGFTDEENYESDQLPESLPPEKFYGNVEYKRQLLKPTKHRLTHLTTQMQFRLTEGNGECRYLIGVNDNGTLHGLKEQDLNETIKIINSMASSLNAETKVLRKRQFGPMNSLQAAEIFVRQIQSQPITTQQPIAILGNADAGKSTLVGVITTGELDNGKGKSRLQMFRHPHEISSGKTSSVSLDFLGFNADGPLRATQFRNKDELLLNSTKIIEFWDLAGDARYLKTTIYGLTSCSPNYCIITISGNKGILGTTEEHLLIAQALKLTIIIVITKIDLCSKSQLEETIKLIESTVGAVPFNLIPMMVDSNDKVLNMSKKFDQSESSLVPIFLTSSVTGEGLDLLTSFLNYLPTKKKDEFERQRPVQFQIDNFWYQNEHSNQKPRPRKTVKIHGRLLSGIIKQNETLRIGPDFSGQFYDTKIESIKRNELNVRSIEAGQLATMRVSVPQLLALRKGSYLVSDQDQEICCFEFLASVELLRPRTLSDISDHGHSPERSPKENSLRVGQTVVCHVANVRQTVLIKEIAGMDGTVLNKLHSASNGMIKFKFINHPELIQPQSSILFRDGGTRGSGVVEQIFPVYS